MPPPSLLLMVLLPASGWPSGVLGHRGARSMVAVGITGLGGCPAGRSAESIPEAHRLPLAPLAGVHRQLGLCVCVRERDTALSDCVCAWTVSGCTPAAGSVSRSLSVTWAALCPLESVGGSQEYGTTSPKDRQQRPVRLDFGQWIWPESVVWSLWLRGTTGLGWGGCQESRHSMVCRARRPQNGAMRTWTRA